MSFIMLVWHVATRDTKVLATYRILRKSHTDTYDTGACANHYVHPASNPLSHRSTPSSSASVAKLTQ